MVLLFLATAAIAFFRVWQSGQLRFVLTPVAVLPLWLWLRTKTPREGMMVSTIGATPGAVVMLSFAAASLLSMAILAAIDIYVFDHPSQAPLKLYHVALFAPPFVLLFAGAYRGEQIKRAQMAMDA